MSRDLGGSGLWAEGQEPAANDQGQKKEKGYPLGQKRMAQAVQRLASQELSKGQAAEQPEEVGTKVCVFTGAAQCGQKGRPCHEGDEEVIARDFSSSLVGEDGQHANDCKHCGGKADKLMLRAMDEDIDQVAATGGEKDGEETKPGAGNAAEKMNEPPANEAVAQEVDRVGMQGQGSQQAPPFSLVEDAFPVSCPLHKPE